MPISNRPKRETRINRYFIEHLIQSICCLKVFFFSSFLFGIILFGRCVMSSNKIMMSAPCQKHTKIVWLFFVVVKSEKKEQVDFIFGFQDNFESVHNLHQSDLNSLNWIHNIIVDSEYCSLIWFLCIVHANHIHLHEQKKNPICDSEDLLRNYVWAFNKHRPRTGERQSEMEI